MEAYGSRKFAEVPETSRNQIARSEAARCPSRRKKLMGVYGAYKAKTKAKVRRMFACDRVEFISLAS